MTNLQKIKRTQLLMLERIGENCSVMPCATTQRHSIFARFSEAVIEEQMNLEDAILALRAELAILDEAIEVLEVLASNSHTPKSKRTRGTMAIVQGNRADSARRRRSSDRRQAQELKARLRILAAPPKARIPHGKPPASQDLS
jgi:hypothetical protein